MMRHGRSFADRRKKQTPAKNFACAFLLTLVLALASCAGRSAKEPQTHDFGVFLGASDEDVLQRSEGYRLIAVDGQDISAETVKKLKDDGHVVYGYLSVGSLENYRPYYDDFKDMILGSYENWPDEYWIDVSDERWQSFVVDSLATAMKKKGFDGVFVDNTDVYYNYPSEQVYTGLKTIIFGIRQHELPAMVNGGDSFVTRLIDEGDADLINSVSQESVFSCIEDYEENIFARQEPEETEYFKEYVERVSAAGIDVYLIEYTIDAGLISEINEYCAGHGYHYYVSAHVGLD